MALSSPDELLWFQFLGKGGTRRCCKAFGDEIERAGYLVSFSPNGWTTPKTWREFLMNIRTHAPYDEKEQRGGRWYWKKPIHLVCDVFKVHLDTELRNWARKKFKIIMHYIPAGCTDELQPLDRFVFGAVKAISRKLYREWAWGQARHSVSGQQAAQFLMQAWGQINVSTLRRAWGHLVKTTH
jgi:hypothetical protein